MTRKRAFYARPTARAQTGMKLVEDPAERFVYAMCDGMTDLSSPVFLPVHRSALCRLLKRGVVRRCPKGFQGTRPDIEGVLFSITGRCNMRCRHCYMGAPEGQGELSLENMQRILDALCVSGATQISLTGGEPLMRTDLMELIDAILARGMAIPDIFTNATLIDDAFLAELAARGLDPIFHISFDGVGRHDVMRGVPGAENAARQGIAALKNAGHRVILTTSVDENTLPALEKTYAFARETGVHAWGIGRPIAAGCAKSMGRVADEDFAASCRALKERWEADGRPFTLGLESYFSHAVTRDMQHDIPEFAPGQYACGSCRAYPHVTHEGILMPCPCYADTEFAGAFPSLVSSDWYAAWHDPTLRRVMDVRKEEVLKANPDCACCERLAECRTGCRVSAMLAGNGLLGRDEITCNIFRKGLRA